MKPYTKIALLVALALFLTVTACTRQASKPPVTTPTTTGEAPFPYATAGTVSNLATQTALAGTPQANTVPGAGAATNTPEVLLATLTPAAQAGGQGQGGNTEAGGGQTVPQSNGPAINTPVVTRPTTYTLQKGEFPYCIARRYGLDIPSFFQANNINNNSKLSAGASLTIPAAGDWNNSFGTRSLQAHPATYTVGAGDTVNSIACKFGDVTPEAILAVNGLTNASDLKAGTSIKIP